MAKIMTSVMLEPEIHQRAIELGLNISEICNDALAGAVHYKRIKINPMVEVEKEWPKDIRLATIEALQKSPMQYAKGRCRLIKNLYGIKVSVNELLEWFDENKE